jgi:hypothetical protein
MTGITVHSMQEASRQVRRPESLLIFCIRAWLAKREAGSLIIAPMSPSGFTIQNGELVQQARLTM